MFTVFALGSLGLSSGTSSGNLGELRWALEATSVSITLSEKRIVACISSAVQTLSSGTVGTDQRTGGLVLPMSVKTSLALVAGAETTVGGSTISTGPALWSGNHALVVFDFSGVFDVLSRYTSETLELVVNDSTFVTAGDFGAALTNAWAHAGDVPHSNVSKAISFDHSGASVRHDGDVTRD